MHRSSLASARNDNVSFKLEPKASEFVKRAGLALHEATLGIQAGKGLPAQVGMFTEKFQLQRLC